MLYELRVYETMPGKLPALNDRFENHTTGFFRDHGIGMLGFWTDEIGDSNKLTYILNFESMSDRDEKWSAFNADRRWQEVRAETEQDGPIVGRVLNSFLNLTPYSPVPSISSNVQELRTYEAVPGKLPALNDRFANHTNSLFQKHGIDVVGYWTEVVGTSNELIYMLGYDGLADREEKWANFQNDPDWIKARTASEVDGPLNRRAHNQIIRRTAYSPK